MLRNLRRRATKRGLDQVLEVRECSQETLGLSDLRGGVDLAVAIHTVHEALHPARFLAETWDALRPGGRLVLMESRGHVSHEHRDWIFRQAEETEFEWLADLSQRRSQGALYRKPKD